MEVLLILVGFLIVIGLIILVIRVPIMIANARGITGSELTTIRLLSWVSLLVAVTWIIALIMSLVYQPNKWIDKQPEKEKEIDYASLEKIHDLKEKGILSEEEYIREKNKILGK